MTLEALANSLAKFPCCDDPPVALALLEELAKGEPVSVGRLARAVDRDEADLVATLDRWPNVHRDARGRVVAFAGLSVSPTRHRFEVAGRRLYTVGPNGIPSAQPPSLQVSFPAPASTVISDITASFCCHVHFLAGQDAAAAWLAENHGGLTLSLEEAVELGRLATRPLLDVRRTRAN
jgi:alkylmercury lyase